MFSKNHANKIKLGQVDDDVHVCIMCMRAIMNNKYGFNLVMVSITVLNKKFFVDEKLFKTNAPPFLHYRNKATP